MHGRWSCRVAALTDLRVEWLRLRGSLREGVYYTQAGRLIFTRLKTETGFPGIYKAQPLIAH